MRVKIVDLTDEKGERIFVDEAEKRLNAALKELDGYFINDVKVSPDCSIAIITYTETRKK